MESVIEKLGKVSVTVEKDYHNSEKEYNKLTIVEEQGAFKTYISRKPVPVGIELTNREYWIPFSGIKESLIIDYEKFKKEINDNINPIVIAYLVAHPELIVNVQNKSINIPKLAEDVINWFDKLQTDIDIESNTARFNEKKNADAIHSEINRAQTIELSIQKTLENITKTGEASAASNVTYVDNIEIGSANLQDAIDKIGNKTLDGEKNISELGLKLHIAKGKIKASEESYSTRIIINERENVLVHFILSNVGNVISSIGVSAYGNDKTLKDLYFKNVSIEPSQSVTFDYTTKFEIKEFEFAISEGASDIDIIIEGPSFDEKIETLRDKKVDKIEGKGLSTNDYTDDDRYNLLNMQQNLYPIGNQIIDFSSKTEGNIAFSDIQLTLLTSKIYYIHISTDTDDNNNLYFIAQKDGINKKVFSLTKKRSLRFSVNTECDTIRLVCDSLQTKNKYNVTITNDSPSIDEIDSKIKEHEFAICGGRKTRTITKDDVEEGHRAVIIFLSELGYTYKDRVKVDVNGTVLFASFVNVDTGERQNVKQLSVVDGYVEIPIVDNRNFVDAITVYQLIDNNSATFYSKEIQGLKGLFPSDTSKFPTSNFDNMVKDFDSIKVNLPNINIPLAANKYIITVSNQEEFESIGNSFNNAITMGETNIEIVINKGVYLHGGNQPVIYANNIKNDNLIVNIVGKNATIIGADKNNVYTSDEASIENGMFKVALKNKGSNNLFNPANIFIDDNFIDYNMWSEFKYSKSIITTDTTIYPTLRRFESADAQWRYVMDVPEEDMSSEDCADIYVHITHGWMICVWKVDRIENGKMYFYGSNHSGITQVTNTYVDGINLDYNDSKMFPRYRFINKPNSLLFVKNGFLYFSTTINKLYECTMTNLFEFKNCDINHIGIHGFKFYGSSYCDSTNNAEIAYSLGVLIAGNIIKFYKTKAINYIDISNNEINKVTNTAISIANTDNVLIHNNTCKDTYVTIIHQTSNSKNIYVFDNKFLNCNRRHFNNGIICTQGENFNVFNNFIEDFGAWGICVSTSHYNIANVNVDIYGIIEGNTMINKSSHDRLSSIMDSGAIYVYQLQSRIIIRDNVILSPIGAYHNNGIYVDDGGRNTKIYRNLIAGTISGYDITARCDDGFNKTVGAHISDYSSGNLIVYNILGGVYCLEGQTITSNTVDGINLMLSLSKNILNNKIKNNQYVEDNIKSELLMKDDYTIYIPRKIANAFILLPFKKNVLQHIRFL